MGSLLATCIPSAPPIFHSSHSYQVLTLIEGQGCTLAVPSGPMHLTFAPGQLENLRFLLEIMLGGSLDSGLSSVFPRVQP